jgi:MFS transporter, PPP family, 3-phenylpropionic acid transporter
MAYRFFISFITWSIFQTYWGMWLAGKGFGPFQIGVVVGISLIARSIAAGLIFPILNGSRSLHQITSTLPWIVAICAALYCLVDGFGLLLLASLMFGLSFPILLPLYDTSATVGARRGLFKYGPMRAFGSAGFIFGTVLTGWLVAFWGSDILANMLFLSCLLLAALGLFPSKGSDVLDVCGAGLRDVAILLTNCRFVATLLIASLVQASHAAYFTFASPHLLTFAPINVIPLALVIAPVAELIMFLLARDRLENFGVRNLFRIGIATSVIRWGLSGLTDDWIIFSASQVLHAGSFAVTHLAFALYVRDHIDLGKQASAYSLYSAIAMGLATALLTVLAGWLMQYSVAATFSAMGLCAASAALLLRLVPTHADKPVTYASHLDRTSV